MSMSNFYSPKVWAAATEDDLVGIKLHIPHLDHHITQFSLQTKFSKDIRRRVTHPFLHITSVRI